MARDLTDGAAFFSATYQVARQRFCEAAQQAKARLESYAVETFSDLGEELFVDVASLGSENPRWTVVISSGLHGVEGFLGSAIQLAWLQEMSKSNVLTDGAVVLIHAINPYGFACVRRGNEDNVDLNRNFRNSPEEYHGAPADYEALDPLLNPTSPPEWFEFFAVKAWREIRRRGLAVVKNAVAGGQHEFPLGLFYGGWEPAQTTHLVQTQFQQWTAGAEEIVHVDFHSGLGRFGEYRMLLVEESDGPQVEWYRDTFGPGVVEPRQHGTGTSYTAHGEMGEWLADHLKESAYRFALAEFGTYSPIRVLGALRRENRAHFYGIEKSRSFRRAKRELVECFCPRSHQWRAQAIQNGLRIIQQGIEAVNCERA